MTSRGILIANLGSPAAPDVPSVRAFLNEFLMDRHVLDVPWPLRRLIVSAFILPTRPKRSAAAYASIWGSAEPGSPLLHHTQALVEALQQRLDMPVACGMRYGEPSLATALDALAAVDEILLVPLYPQHADSTRTTTIERTRELLGPRQRLRVVPPYYRDPGFIDALVRSVEPHLANPVDHVLFSYHGLPERHIQRADPTGEHCLNHPDCCTTPSAAHATCYRHQCFETTRLVVERLGIDAHTTSFQSRLGRLPWLTPYTDQTLEALPQSNVRNVLVVCPAFAADNLETLEEIGIAGRATFERAGGIRLTLVPCLNADAAWVDVLAEWCQNPPPEAAFDRTDP